MVLTFTSFEVLNFFTYSPANFSKTLNLRDLAMGLSLLKKNPENSCVRAKKDSNLLEASLTGNMWCLLTK